MEDLKEKVDEVIEDNNEVKNEVYKCVKDNVSKFVDTYFEKNSINAYKLEDAIRTEVNRNIKSTGFDITEHSNLDTMIRDSIKENTQKYVSELVRGEVYNILKTGELREVVKETIKSVLPMIIYNNLANCVDAEISNNFYNKTNNSIKEKTDIISNRIKL